jgi:ABC-type transporter Mla MlaB component
MLREQLVVSNQLPESSLEPATLLRNFQLLQACDNLSLLSCVDFAGHATLLHSFATSDGATTEITVQRIGERIFRLSPYPFAAREMSFTFPARFVPGDTFASSEELRNALTCATTQNLTVTITA